MRVISFRAKCSTCALAFIQILSYFKEGSIKWVNLKMIYPSASPYVEFKTELSISLCKAVAVVEDEFEMIYETIVYKSDKDRPESELLN